MALLLLCIPFLIPFFFLAPQFAWVTLSIWVAMILIARLGRD
jgi:hypothetical protein